MRAGRAEPAHAPVGLCPVKPADDGSEPHAEGIEQHGQRPLVATVPHGDAGESGR